MNTVELLQYSLGFAFAILKQVTADLTQEQADWNPPGTAHTIGAIYWHTLTYVDYFVRQYCMEGKRLPETVESRPDALRMRAVEADMSELHQFASEVESTAQGWLSSLTPAQPRVMNSACESANRTTWPSPSPRPPWLGEL